jgi:hypothetical protein
MPVAQVTDHQVSRRGDCVSLFEAPPQAEDRRVRRSRTLLFAAAIKLVTERETTAITVSDLADTADVSRG